MLKTKVVQKQKEKAFLAFSVICLSLLLVGLIFAKTVPQKIGFGDMKFTSLNKELCQGCHGDSLGDTHHGTKHAVSGNCVFCHSASTQSGNVGISLERNCMACHEQSPHHAAEDAKNKKCTSCHDSPGVSDYSTEVPSYEPSKITPTPGDCEKCHGEGVVDGQKVFNAKDTHHGISFKECNACHDVINLSANQEQGDKKSINIRTCERCHNVKALHEVVPHLEKESCVVCHGGKTVAAGNEVEEQSGTSQPEEKNKPVEPKK